MKSLFLIAVISKVLSSAHYNQSDEESFFLLKCIIYLIISSIHSVVLNVPLPIGAFIMFIMYLFETKNRKIKLKIIATGLLFISLSFLNYELISYPFQKLYLYLSTYETQKIEIYTHTSTKDELLSSITDNKEIEELVSSLQSSVPDSSWSTKVLPSDNYFLLKLYLNERMIDVIVSPNPTKDDNIFIGSKYISYTNPAIHSFITKLYPDTPSVLTINTSKDSCVNITNSTILSILWRDVVWGPKTTLTSSNKDMFSIPSYLFFDTTLGCRLFFTSNFEYAYIQDKGIIQLSPYLQGMLNDQFILSQLDPVEELDIFEPSHVYNKPKNTINFSIESNENNLFYGLYREDYTTGEKVLLHTVNSPDANYFLLKDPYILLLDQKANSQYYLMLINQNIPEKHRYISKSQSIIPRSISICPQNTNFLYIIENQENTTLYLADNYYQSPKSIATGIINDSLFLSDNYIVFTEQLDEENLLCIYSTTYSKVIKYILIPGNISLIKGTNNKVYFGVQKADNMNLKQGIFYIDANLTIHKSE